MIKLYHGTNIDFPQIDLTLGKPNKDFGRGFYLTDIRSQALNMAERRSILDGGHPIVQTYLFDNACLGDGNLKVKIFEEVSEEWALFVINNRKSRKQFIHDYDIVIGPVADDGVVMQIDRYLSKMIDLPTLVKELTYRNLNRQYFFGTEAAIQYLKRI